MHGKPTYLWGKLNFFYKILNWLRNYIIAWFALVWLQFVLQFDEEAITWICNDLQKILKSQMIHYLEIIETKQNIYDYTIEKYKRKMCYYQKNNSDVKTFEKPKNIKES